MKMIRLLLTTAMVLVITSSSTAVGKTRPQGSLSGVVLDEVGAPITGALLRLVDPVTPGQTLRSLRTSAKGEFFARNIPPGSYRLRAEARGFISGMQPVEVRPDIVLSLKFELRRVGRLLDARADRDDYKWAVRSVPPPLLRLKEEESNKITVANARPSPSTDTNVHGMVQFIAGGSGNRSGVLSPTYAGVNLALAHQVTRNLEMLLAGQWSPDLTAPQRMEIVATTYPADQHKVTVVLGLGQFSGFTSTDPMLRERQVSLRLTDAWQVAGPVVILYGVDMTRFSGVANEAFAAPRLGLRWSPGTRTNVGLDFQPTSEDPSTGVGYQSENAKVEFAERNGFRSLTPGTRLRANQRLQFGVEQLLTENSSIQAAVFFDDVSGRAVGLLAVPSHASGEFNSVFQELIEQGRTRGARVVYDLRLNKVLSSLIGYAIGQGHELAIRGLGTPSRLLATENFHVVSFKLEGEFAPTRTTYAAYYRIASGVGIFAVDPFYGSMEVVHPGLSLSVSQELPNFGFLPGRWEAGLDARNILAEHERLPGNEGWRLTTGFGRSVRGSVSVRF